MEESKYKIIKNLNARIYFLGMTSMQLLAVFVVSVLSFLILGYLVGLGGVMFAAVLEILIIILALKISRENKKGNPSFIKSYIRFYFSQKRQFLDKSNILKYLEIKKDDRNS